jgi:hypothetical protein
MSAWKVIQHIKVTNSTAVNFTFSSIPQTHTDLLLVFSCRTNLGLSFDDTSIRINGDSSNSYTNRTLRSREGATTPIGGTGNRLDVYESSSTSAAANTFGSGKFYIPNYTLSGNKSISAEGFSGNTNISLIQGGLTAGLWTGNAPVTSITLFSANGTSFVQNSSATLYGITKGSSGGVTVS